MNSKANGLSELLISEKKQRVYDLVAGVIWLILAIGSAVLGSRVASCGLAALSGLMFGQATMRSRIMVYMNIVSVQEAVIEYLLKANGVELDNSEYSEQVEMKSGVLLENVDRKKDRKN